MHITITFLGIFIVPPAVVPAQWGGGPVRCASIRQKEHQIRSPSRSKRNRCESRDPSDHPFTDICLFQSPTLNWAKIRSHWSIVYIIQLFFLGSSSLTSTPVRHLMRRLANTTLMCPNSWVGPTSRRALARDVWFLLLPPSDNIRCFCKQKLLAKTS